MQWQEGADGGWAAPCTADCTIDETLGACRYCARSAAEAADWLAADAAGRRTLWADLVQQRSRAGMTSHVLPQRAGVLQVLLYTLTNRVAGAWEVGRPGLSLAIRTSPERRDAVARQDDGLVLSHGDALLRLFWHDDMIALAFGDIAVAGAVTAVALARPVNDRPEPSDSVRALGGDTGAIRVANRSGLLFDLAVGTGAARIAARSRSEAATKRLTDLADHALGLDLAAVFADLEAERADLVIATPAARAEAPSMGAGAARIDAVALASVLAGAGGRGAEALPGVSLPDAYDLCAVFRPDAGANIRDYLL